MNELTPINIQWLSDSSDCDTCGMSYAEGAVVTGAVTLDLTPSSHCFGGDNWDQSDVYKLILEKLGYIILEDY